MYCLPSRPVHRLQVASTQDELVATEALFAGLFTELTPPEAVALLSALVFQVDQGCLAV